MSSKPAERLNREEWIRSALEILSSGGVEGVKVSPLASRLGVTTGSFYWHFKNRRDLLDELLAYWERELTDAAIVAARQFEGPPVERIWGLMAQVMTEGLARYDVVFWHWAQADDQAALVFQRALQKRFDFAASMFREAGFSSEQAEARGRLMVTYMMGESTLIPDSLANRMGRLKTQFAILIAPVA